MRRIMRKTLEEKIRGSIARHPDWDDRHVAKSVLGSTKAMVLAVREGRPISESIPLPAAPAQLSPNVTLVSVDDIKRKYDMFGAIMDIIKNLPPGQVITEADLKQSIDQPDPFRFKKTMEAHEKELDPYRIMLKYRGSEAKYHYGKPEVIADLRATLERP